VGLTPEEQASVEITVGLATSTELFLDTVYAQAVVSQQAVNTHGVVEGARGRPWPRRSLAARSSERSLRQASPDPRHDVCFSPPIQPAILPGDEVLLHKGEPLYGSGEPACFTPLMRVTSMVIDGAGNIWATNNWKPISAIDLVNSGGDGICIFVGMAKPPARKTQILVTEHSGEPASPWRCGVGAVRRCFRATASTLLSLSYIRFATSLAEQPRNCFLLAWHNHIQPSFRACAVPSTKSRASFISVACWTKSGFLRQESFPKAGVRRAARR